MRTLPSDKIRKRKLKGEVITTPFTSVAPAQAIYWNGLKPVFADISEADLNIDIPGIEKAITPDTCAFMPVHVFGNPCKVDQIEQIARKYKLKLVCDAAHCFGMELNGQSVCNYRDLSVLSFHATKVFNTIEGGAIICRDENTREYLNALKNVGLSSGYKLVGYGLNAKMNEIQAAFGLAQLKYVDAAIENRKAATMKYRELLNGVEGLKITDEKENIKYNYTYFPILINPDEFGANRNELFEYLKARNIFTKKYFYPLVCDFLEFSRYKSAGLPVAERVADNIICLPLYHDITMDEITLVTDAVNELRRKKQQAG
jgi:dTDP-4-amino-4,6-dideoxygalactose transaminase